MWDESNLLAGWRDIKNIKEKIITANAAEKLRQLSFMGIHIISAEIFEYMPDDDIYSIVDLYLKLAAAGKIIQAFPADKYTWLDVGTPENLQEAEKNLRL